MTVPSQHSLLYRKIAARAFPEVVLPHLLQHHPGLVERSFFAVGSSVAYGLADEHSDIDTVLILPEDEYNSHEKEWVSWAYRSPDIASFSERNQVIFSISVSTWTREGVGVLLDGCGPWDGFYGHHHWVRSLIPIHDPLRQMQIIRASLRRLPSGLSEQAAAQCRNRLAALRDLYERLQRSGMHRYVGMLGYSIASQVLPLLFHLRCEPLPFHKWQWPLAVRLGEDEAAVVSQLSSILAHQADGDFPFPDGFAAKSTSTRQVMPIQVGTHLPHEEMERALESVQWHLEERGRYQMVRARARGWHESALHYMCATRCLLIKGAVLLETGHVICGENVKPAWESVRGSFDGLEECIWPRAGEDAVDMTLRGIEVLRQAMNDKQALPTQYQERPLSSPPSYELACVLEEL